MAIPIFPDFREQEPGAVRQPSCRDSLRASTACLMSRISWAGRVCSSWRRNSLTISTPSAGTTRRRATVHGSARVLLPAPLRWFWNIPTVSAGFSSPTPPPGRVMASATTPWHSSRSCARNICRRCLNVISSCKKDRGMWQFNLPDRQVPIGLLLFGTFY